MARGKTKQPSELNQWGRYGLAFFLGFLLALLLLRPAEKGVSGTFFSGGSAIYANPTPTVTFDYRDKPIYLPDSTSTTIATKLLNEYFTNYQNPLTAGDERIEEYSLENVTGIKADSNLFVEVYYAVKPSGSDSFWLTGNGYRTPDGWVRGKYGCVAIREVNGSYQAIRALGPGYCLPE